MKDNQKLGELLEELIDFATKGFADKLESNYHGMGITVCYKGPGQIQINLSE